MRTLIFTQTRFEFKKLKDKYRDQPGFIDSTLSEIGPALETFRKNDVAVMILPIKSAVHGYNVPADTVILFTASVPDGPEKMQAAARARL